MEMNDLMFCIRWYLFHMWRVHGVILLGVNLDFLRF